MIPRYNLGDETFGECDTGQTWSDEGRWVRVADLAPFILTLRSGQWWERAKALDTLSDLVGLPKHKEIPE
jgi:hypothetical protein